MKYVYFELNFLVFFKSLFSNKEIYFFLNDDKNNLKKKILNKKKKCKFLNFETSKINLKNQNIHFVVDKLTNDYTMEIVDDLFNNNIVSECNKRFYNGDLKLAISRYIYLELNPLILKLETINRFLKGKKVINYNLSDEKLKWFIEKKKYGLLSNTNKNSLKTIKLKVSQILFTILNKCLSSFSKRNIDKTDKVLINVENQLNFEKYLRSDFFYLKKNSNKIIISKNKSFDQNTLKNNNVELINNFELIFLRQEKKINLDINKRFDLLFEDKELINNFFGLINYLKNIKFIMKKISPIFLNNKIKCSISTSSDLITLSTEMLRGIFEFKLIRQYSFIKRLNPIMSNCSNMMFIFSMYFFHIFNNFYSKPLETKNHWIYLFIID